MDLLTAIPEDINNEILKYLSVKDILNASCVSKQWYQIIGHSKSCMRKIKVKFGSRNCCNDIKPLLRSKRQYQYIKISFRTGDFTKNAKIESNVKAILKKFSKSIIGLRTTHDFQRVCELPKLKELIISNYFLSRRNSHLLYLNGLLDKCVSIEELIFDINILDEKSSKIVIKALQNAKKLKFLTMKHAGVFENFQPSEYSSKLESLTIEGHHLYNSFDFVKTHKFTLKKIMLSSISLENLNILLSSFPNLQELEFYNISNFETPAVFTQNKTIKKLVARIAYPYFDLAALSFKQNFIALLSSLKDLRALTIDTLFGELLPVIFSLPSLVKVNFWFYSTDFSEAQKTLIETNGQIVFTKT